MSDKPEKKEETTVETPKAKKEGLSSFGSLALVIFAVALACGFMIYGASVTNGDLNPTADSAFPMRDMAARIAQLEERVQSLESKAGFTMGMTHNAPPAEMKAEAPAVETAPVMDSKDLDFLQSKLAGLTTSLSQLQNQIEKSAQLSNQNQANVEVGFARILAFMKLQRRAYSGQPFETERQVMLDAAQDDPALIHLLSKMETGAASGVPDMPELTQQWQDIKDYALTALRRSQAHSWWERVIVALDGLVSIRSLGNMGTDSLILQGITMSLSRGSIGQALEKVGTLPPEVQVVIKDWREHLKTRQELEAMIDDIAAHLMAVDRSKSVGEGVPPPVIVPPENASTATKDPS